MTGWGSPSAWVGEHDDARRSEQVHIDRAEPAAPEAFAIDEVDELLAAQRRQPGEATEGRGYLIAGGEGTQCQHLDDAVVRRSTVVEKQSAEGGLRPAQVICPHRGVDEDHAAESRCRGAAVADGSVPPKAASRRALSTRTSVSSADRNSAERSEIPVSVALSRRVRRRS